MSLRCPKLVNTHKVYVEFQFSADTFVIRWATSRTKVFKQPFVTSTDTVVIDVVGEALEDGVILDYGIAGGCRLPSVLAAFTRVAEMGWEEKGGFH